MDAIALCYFWVNRKKMILQNSFKQIYVFKRDKAEIEKKTVLVHISQNVL